METQSPAPEGTSRVFLYVAAACILIALVVVGAVLLLTRRSAEITIVAKNDEKIVSVPLHISSDPDAGFVGDVTTTVFRHVESFSPTGTKTVDVPATGQITIFNKTSAAVSLVKKTRFLSTGGVLFRLSDKVTIPANGEVAAPVYADEPGKAGEIAATTFTVPGLPEDKQKVVYGVSKNAMTGGTATSGALSQKDIDEAKKTYRSKALAAFTSSVTAPLAPGMLQVAMVTKDALTVDAKPGSEVTNFSVSGDNTIVFITYRKDDVLSALQKELRSTIDATSEKIVSANDEPTVVLTSYNAAAGTAVLSVTQRLVVTIDPNADKLAPANFFEKSKDEIERYVMTLDHVGKVDVIFSPAFINSAPKDPTKIRVIVKDM